MRIKAIFTPFLGPESHLFNNKTVCYPGNRTLCYINLSQQSKIFRPRNQCEKLQCDICAIILMYGSVIIYSLIASTEICGVMCMGDMHG